MGTESSPGDRRACVARSGSRRQTSKPSSSPGSPMSTMTSLGRSRSTRASPARRRRPAGRGTRPGAGTWPPGPRCGDRPRSPPRCPRRSPCTTSLPPRRWRRLLMLGKCDVPRQDTGGTAGLDGMSPVVHHPRTVVRWACTPPGVHRACTYGSASDQRVPAERLRHPRGGPPSPVGWPGHAGLSGDHRGRPSGGGGRRPPRPDAALALARRLRPPVPSPTPSCRRAGTGWR